MARLSPQPKFTAFDSNGDPLSGGKLYTYIAGTTTPKDTFTDESGDTANANPVILDANGQADVWLESGSYKFVLDSSADVTQWTVDDIVGDSGNAFASTVVTQASNLNVTSVYDNNFILCTASLTLSLLPAADAEDGFFIIVKNDSGGNVTIDPDGLETIDGAATLVLADGDSAIVVTNGTAWYTSGYYQSILGLNNTFTGNNTFSGDTTFSGDVVLPAGVVDVDDLADGTDGELITWGADGVATTVAAGTAGQVLTSNGAGAAPTFQTLTTTYTGSAAASASIPLAGTSKKYRIVGWVKAATDNVSMQVQFSSDGGSSYLNTSYRYSNNGRGDDGAGLGGSSTSATGIFITGADNVGNASGEEMQIDLVVFPKGSTDGINAGIKGNIGYTNPSGQVITNDSFGKYTGTQADMDYLRLIASSGNITYNLTVEGVD